MTQLILASSSPRRRTLLAFLTDQFQVQSPDVDETLEDGAVAGALEQLATRKADAINATGDCVVLAADTAVLLGERVLGKPANASEAATMLRELAANPHQVITAVAIHGPQGHAQFHVQSTVTLDCDDSRIDAYVDSGAWQGKAGGYGVQDEMLRDHVSVDGPWSNVVGLPLHAVHQALMDQGIHCHHPPSEQDLRNQNPF